MVISRPGGVAGGIAAHKVVNDIIDINRVGLGQRLAIVGVGPDVADPRGVGAFHMGAKLLFDRIGNNRILHREGVRVNGINAVPLTELDGDVVEDHVVAGRAEVDGAGTGAAATLTEAHMPADNVIFPGKGNLVVHHPNASARRSLPGDGEVVRAGHRAAEGNITAHVKNNDAIWLAHRVPE